MTLNLTSIRAKLARAAEHAQVLKNEIKAWSERSPYGIVEDRNAECTRYSIILRVNEAPPFQRWTLIAGDYLNNLRAALDHLVYAIAASEAAPNSPKYERKLAFPITDCRDDFDDALAKRKLLGDISAPAKAIIERQQPYHRRHPTLPPLLSILRDLNNSDKHRLLRMVYSAVYKGDIGFVGDWPPDAKWKALPHSGELEDGTEIFAMLCDRPAPDVHYDRKNFEVAISIWHGKRDPSDGEGTDRSEVSALLSALGAEVRTVIYQVADRIR